MWGRGQTNHQKTWEARKQPSTKNNLTCQKHFPQNIKFLIRVMGRGRGRAGLIFNMVSSMVHVYNQFYLIYTKCDSLYLRRKLIAIHSSVKTDSTKMYTVPVNNWTNLSDLRTITYCTKIIMIVSDLNYQKQIK